MKLIAAPQLRTLAAVAGVFSLGYFFGVQSQPEVATAQPVKPVKSSVAALTEASQRSLRSSYDAMGSAAKALISENAYNPGTLTLNAFAISCGGVDAVKDLENGRGVDPETFAAIYAGESNEKVAPHLSKDKNGRYLFKGKLIRMYSVDRLKELFKLRREIAQIRK